ncbi:hypothetical protein CY34DRAFT_720222 [Suillus luteus UH-Slu-Lm8-n1]|uniref:Uncharacterized protein n=1 Tax=Suillus luteus UH-Slu-Lm8-n1 TaxID=930992 RepID=A0A0D0A4U3_9AGAM|nr:hypothetical protein CY34DRAFT_720222 [Suillus luteus UH-Slu-Lm8-n1]
MRAMHSVLQASRSRLNDPVQLSAEPVWASSPCCRSHLVCVGWPLRLSSQSTWLLGLRFAMPLHKLDPQGHPNYPIIRSTDLTE